MFIAFVQKWDHVPSASKKPRVQLTIHDVSKASPPVFGEAIKTEPVYAPLLVEADATHDDVERLAIQQLVKANGYRVGTDTPKGGSDLLARYWYIEPELEAKTPGEKPYTNSFERSLDFYDRTRDFEQALDALLEELRGINDPHKKNDRIKQLEIYAGSIKRFIDQSETEDRMSVPAEMAEGFSYRLKGVDWSKVSDHANKWANTIVKIIDGLLRGGA